MSRYAQIRRSESWAKTWQFWNAHRSWACFAPAILGVLIAVARYLLGHGFQIANPAVLIVTAGSYVIGLAGSFLINYIWATPADLYSKQNDRIANLITDHEVARREFIAAHEATKQELAAEREKNSTPKIRGRIIEGFFQDWGSMIMEHLVKGRTLRTSSAWITLNVGLVNATPSRPVTIKDYSLVIETPAGTLKPQREVPFVPFSIDRASRQRRTDYPHADGLLRQEQEQIFELEKHVRSHPLAHGVEVTGFVRFVIADIEALDVDYKDEGVFKLQVDDSLGGVHEIVRPAGPWPDSGSLCEP